MGFPIQILLNGLVAGSVYSLVALGFALIYATTRFFHFAHGAIYTAAAYTTYGLCSIVHIPLGLSIGISILFAGFLGIAVETSIYRPLRRKYASGLVLLIASFGIYIVLQNTISLIFGDNVRMLRHGPPKEGLLIWGARLTPLQIFTAVASALLFLLISLAVRYTRIGKAMRAVANDPELALVSGINSDRIILLAFAVGSALAAVAAILVSFDIDMIPTMGMNALLMGVVATIIGGIGSIPGAAVGGLLLGLAQHLGIWKLGSQWQDSIAFAVLMFFLIIKPYGVFGRRIKKAEI